MQGTQQSLRKGTILSGNSYNYKIEGILGQGSSGIAYLASIQLQGELGCLNTHTQVAIKEFFQKNFKQNSFGKPRIFQNSNIHIL